MSSKTITNYKILWTSPEGNGSEDGFYTKEEAVEYGSDIDSYFSSKYDNSQYNISIEEYDVEIRPVSTNLF